MVRQTAEGERLARECVRMLTAFDETLRKAAL
jgi:hypothetical protein